MAMTRRPIITLLTDFGLRDHYVAAMKGVILGICPEAQLVDITHQIPAFAIGQGAFVLGQAYECFPPGTIHLAVVDPGVGSSRRPLLLEASKQFFVGPDNGVFSIPMQRDPRHKAREINASRYFRQPVSNTFHGRDIFAPVAAQLAAGISASKLGRGITDTVRLNPPLATRDEQGIWTGSIIYIDGFGNIVTSFLAADVPEITREPFEMRLGKTIVSQYYDSYEGAPGGVPVAVRGSAGYIEVSLNQQDVAVSAGLRIGSPIVLKFLAGQYS